MNDNQVCGGRAFGHTHLSAWSRRGSFKKYLCPNTPAIFAVKTSHHLARHVPCKRTQTFSV